MSSSGTIPLQDIWKMLDKCAPGHKRVQKTHHWWITYKGKTYTGLPLGGHGSRRSVSIEVGHVKKMCRFLEITECAKEMIERPDASSS